MKSNSEKGKVVCIRYESLKITSKDLKNLASPFGKISHLFTASKNRKVKLVI